jgi:hypothetical protein
MRKHGVENFIFEIIEECSDSTIDDRERFWISELDSMNSNKGYNIDPCGRGMTDAARQTLSEALKGNTHCVGRVLGPETRDKLRKCWPIAHERRLGAKDEVVEVRTCHCGTSFKVEFSQNRRYHVRTTCSDACSHRRQPSTETRSKISASTKFEPSSELLQAIVNTPLVDLMKEHGVSYSTLKRLKKSQRELALD